MSLKTRSIVVPAAALVAFATCGAAHASYTTAAYVSGTGLEALGAFTAGVSYEYLSGSTASLAVTLTNTSNPGNGGYLTAIAISAGGAATITGMASCTDPNFGWIGPGITASPFGDFEGGASTSSSWLGGGSPTAGLAVGESATFTFIVAGSSAYLSTLTAASILAPTEGYGFVVRFRGFENGGSDKTPGIPQEIIPGPGGLAVLALGGICRSRRIRRA